MKDLAKWTNAAEEAMPFKTSHRAARLIVESASHREREAKTDETKVALV